MDAAQLAQLYERYGALVHRRCVSLARDSADADDALQETFWRVKKYGVPPTGEPTLAWLYRIAANCCFDQRKRQRRERAETAEALERSPASHVGTPADSDRRALVGTILNQFDATTREIGVLHHLDGFTQEEIAVRTGYTRKTVGKKLASFETAFIAWWQRATGGAL